MSKKELSAFGFCLPDKEYILFPLTKLGAFVSGFQHQNFASAKFEGIAIKDYVLCGKTEFYIPIAKRR